MKNCLWVFSVFFGLIFISPLLLIMIALVRTEIPMSTAIIYWLPISIAGSLAMTYWYSKQSRKQLEKQTDQPF